MGTKKHSNREYMILIGILIAGLLMTTFIKPFMENFREGNDISEINKPFPVMNTVLNNLVSSVTTTFKP